MISFSHKDYRKGGLFFRTGGYKTPRRQKTVRGVSKLKAYNEQLKKLYPGYAAKLKNGVWIMACKNCNCEQCPEDCSCENCTPDMCECVRKPMEEAEKGWSV